MWAADVLSRGAHSLQPLALQPATEPSAHAAALGPGLASHLASHLAGREGAPWGTRSAAARAPLCQGRRARMRGGRGARPAQQPGPRARLARARRRRPWLLARRAVERGGRACGRVAVAVAAARRRGLAFGGRRGPLRLARGGRPAPSRCSTE